jgi:hypothetical protein
MIGESHVKTFQGYDLECIEDINRGAFIVEPYIVTKNINKNDDIWVDLLVNKCIKGKVLPRHDRFIEVDLGWSSSQTKVVADCVKVVDKASKDATWLLNGEIVNVRIHHTDIGSKTMIVHPITGELY